MAKVTAADRRLAGCVSSLAAEMKENQALHEDLEAVAVAAEEYLYRPGGHMYGCNAEVCPVQHKAHKLADALARPGVRTLLKGVQGWIS